MERLTWTYRADGYDDVGLRDGVTVGDAICRLADYEDTLLEPEEITTAQPACVFYCNRKCNVDGDWCPEGPGCPWGLSPEDAARILRLARVGKTGRVKKQEKET